MRTSFLNRSRCAIFKKIATRSDRIRKVEFKLLIFTGVEGHIGVVLGHRALNVTDGMRDRIFYIKG